MVGDPGKIVDIPDKLQTSFYDNVSEYGILQLETTEESLLSNILKIRVYNDRIFILSGLSDSRLLAFDKDGKFITEVGRRGRGPAEYVKLHNFEIDPTGGELLLLDKAGKKILIHGLDGAFRREVEIPSGPECAGRLPNGNFVLSYVGSQLKFNDYHVISICDKNGKMLEQHMENKINASINSAAIDMMTAMDDGSLSLAPQYHNMIYHITNNGITADIGFQIPGETITVNDFDQDFKDSQSFLTALNGKNYIAGDHTETDEYIFFHNKGMMELEHVFYNKTNGKSLRAAHPLFGTSLFIDNKGCCWATVNEAMLKLSEKGDDELTKLFLYTFGKYENVPLIYYKLKI